MISLSRTVRLQRFLALITYYQQYRPSTGIFSFPPHLFRAATLPWQIVKT